MISSCFRCLFSRREQEGLNPGNAVNDIIPVGDVAVQLQTSTSSSPPPIEDRPIHIDGNRKIETLTIFEFRQILKEEMAIAQHAVPEFSTIHPLVTLIEQLYNAALQPKRREFTLKSGDCIQTGTDVFLCSALTASKHNLIYVLDKVNIPIDFKTRQPLFALSDKLTSLLPECSNLLNALVSTSQKNVQKNLKSLIVDNKWKFAIDTSSSKHPLPLMKFPEMSDSIPLVSNRATPTITSAVMPMILEITGKNEDPHGFIALRRAMEQVWSMSKINDTLKLIIGFATNGSSEATWMVAFKREFDDLKKKQPKEELEVIRLQSTELIVSLWDHCNYAALRSPLFYIHKDWFPIMNALKAMNIHAGYCGIRLLPTHDVGAARIYTIDLPMMDYEDKHVCIAFGSRASFVVKIQTDIARANHEIDVLKVIRQYCIDNNALDTIHAWKYVVMTCGKNKDDTTMFHELKDLAHLIPFTQYCEPNYARFNPYRMTRNTIDAVFLYNVNMAASSIALYTAYDVWWNIQSPIGTLKAVEEGAPMSLDTEVNYHAIVMFRGIHDAVPHILSLKRCLDEIATAGYLHTDCRTPNMMLFPNGVIPRLPNDRTSFMIDYDHATRITTSDGKAFIDVSHPGQRRSHVLSVFRRVPDDEHRVAWDVKQDCDMMIAFHGAYVFHKKRTSSSLTIEENTLRST